MTDTMEDLSPLDAASHEKLCSLEERLTPLRQQLIEHPMYAAVNSVEVLCEFMQLHVFAVWDFMSLAKRLQREYTCVDVPWTPPADPQVARFVNEVVLAEECDLGPDGRALSHLEMYLAAMGEVGSSTVAFEGFLQRIVSGEDPIDVLASADLPAGATPFVRGTLECALEAPTVEVAAEFLYGREDVIPDMFQKLLDLWEGREQDVPLFAYYLRRHIELDGEQHGPMAARLLVHAATHTEMGWSLAAQAAERAIRRRIEMWTAFASRFEAKPAGP
jgi:hypothetical protein